MFEASENPRAHAIPESGTGTIISASIGDSSQSFLPIS